MTIKINKILLVVLVLGLLVGLFFAGRLSTRNERLGLQSQTSESKDSLKHFKVVIDSLTYYVAQKDQTIATKENAIMEGRIERDKYKKLYYSKIEHEIQLNATIAALLDSIKNNAQVIYVYKDNDSIPCAKLPFSFSKKDQYLDLSGSFDERAKMSMSLKMDVPLDVVIGLKKKGTPSVSVLTQNPYCNITKINGLKVVDDKKWYDSPWIYVGSGFVGGVLLSRFVK